jgi:hypothetical protein
VYDESLYSVSDSHRLIVVQKSETAIMQQHGKMKLHDEGSEISFILTVNDRTE